VEDDRNLRASTLAFKLAKALVCKWKWPCILTSL